MDCVFDHTLKGLSPISSLAHIYDNTVATYKFYWFASILDMVVKEGKEVMSFWEIIAGMISESWYPIHYFRLSFGKSDSLYQQSKALRDHLGIPVDYDRDRVRSLVIDHLKDPETLRLLRIFTRNVPYRFLSPWIREPQDDRMEWRSRTFENNCLYAIHGKEIRLNPRWKDYLTEHYVLLRDFTFWNLNQFLEKRNPNVPELSSKLIRPVHREPLTGQRRLWNLFLHQTDGVECIYTHSILTREDYDLDHFIPWSFVAHNQMWDLLPADPGINSSKSDQLPPLDVYIRPFSRLQHAFLSFIYLAKPDERLLEDYLQISESISELVSLSDEDFSSAFRRILSPLEQIALNMGFSYMKSQ